ncbi:MAG: hypothetical protein SFY32_15370 [Bacteroidota bacterium]|nr:hypothetical protein [Bacteroidota bacterium]
MKNLYYHNNNLQLYYNDIAKAAIVHLDPTINSNDYRKGLEASLDLIYEKKVKKWVANFSETIKINETDQKWSEEVWFPSAIGLGLQRVAVIVSKKVFLSLKIEERINIEEKFNLVSQYFDDEITALVWIAGEHIN